MLFFFLKVNDVIVFNIVVIFVEWYSFIGYVGECYVKDLW